MSDTTKALLTIPIAGNETEMSKALRKAAKVIGAGDVIESSLRVQVAVKDAQISALLKVREAAELFCYGVTAGNQLALDASLTAYSKWEKTNADK